MKKTSFTKGDWIAEKFNNSDYIDIESVDGRICCVHVGEDAVDGAEANAQLISASPDMLDKLNCSTQILESILELFGSDMAMTTKFGVTQQIKENKQAINKATGE
jgi:hypothetical protein